MVYFPIEGVPFLKRKGFRPLAWNLLKVPLHLDPTIAEFALESFDMSQIAAEIRVLPHGVGFALHLKQILAIVLVQFAKTLLANPQLRISEIAYEAGFNSLTHFNRMFRRIAGTSPTMRRKSSLG